MMHKHIKIPDGWEVYTFGDIITKSQYGTSNSSEATGKIPMIKMNNLNDGKLFTDNISYINLFQEEFKKLKLKKGDLLFNRTNSYDLVGKTALFELDGDFTFASYIVRFKLDRDIANPKYINYFFNLFTSKNRLKSLATKGVSQVNINPTVLQKFFLIPLPSMKTQQKIVETLSTWDRAIDKMEKLIEAKIQHKKALMQQLLTGKKRYKKFRRAKGYKKIQIGVIPKDWDLKSINELFEERVEKSSNTSKYPIHSLTIDNGITHKTERYERSFLLKNKEKNEYRLVYPNDFVYNPKNLRFGALARSKLDKTVSISAYYNIITLKNANNDISYFEKLLKSERMINLYNRISTGSLVEKRRVHLSQFLKIKIPVPSIKEQQKIASVLGAADEEIELLTKQLDAVKKQKRGLMQKLLTGKIRVKVKK
jgi:type I restriction enzyme S subunit